jgi:hypothetical protein
MTLFNYYMLDSLIAKNPAKFFTAIYDWPVTLLSAFLESRKLAAPLNPS